MNNRIERFFTHFRVHSSQSYFIYVTEFVCLSFGYCCCLCLTRWLFNCSLLSFCNFSCSVSLFQIFVFNSFRRYYFNWWYLCLWMLLLLWMAIVHCIRRRANDIYIIHRYIKKNDYTNKAKCPFALFNSNWPNIFRIICYSCAMCNIQCAVCTLPITGNVTPFSISFSLASNQPAIERQYFPHIFLFLFNVFIFIAFRLMQLKVLFIIIVCIYSSWYLVLSAHDE